MSLLQGGIRSVLREHTIQQVGIHGRLNLLTTEVTGAFPTAQSLDVYAFPLSLYPDAALFGHADLIG